ncbi:MAG: hypothetical protein KC535_04580, partial [Nanoarchaeota archaeon]|nr:hypothetical protein [Nanoarchaeota archaeon]
LDITGGMYADINTDMKEALGWIFEPFHIKKYSEKNLGILDEEQMKKVLFEIHERIDRYLLGETGKTAIESNYSIIKQTDKWALVEEQGPYARSELIKDGIQAFVSFIDEKTNHLGTFHDYTIAKASLWVAHFDIEKIYEHLNKEGRHITEHNRWGGTRIIGGSPRQTGSILTPEKIFKEINELNGDRPFWRKWFSFWK